MDTNSDSNIDKKFWIHWNMSPEEIINSSDELIKKSSVINNNIAKFNFEEKSNLLSFLSLLSDDISEFQIFHSMCGFLQYVSPEKEVRRASKLADIKLTKYADELNLRTDIYNKLKEFYIIADQSKILKDEDKRFINKLINTYERNGVNLNQNEKKKLIKIKSDINDLENYINKNIYFNENMYMEFDTSDLIGLKDSFLKEYSIDKKKFKIPINKSNYNHMIRFLDKSDIRKKIETFYAIKNKELIPNIAKLIVLRDKHAKLLSYKCHSDYKASNQMIKNSENIKNFLTELLHKLDYRYRRELDSLFKIMMNNNNNNINGINSWDIAYYVNKWKEEYGIDENVIKEYFELNYTLKAIIKIYEILFNIKFKKLNKPFNWHPNVDMYSIYDLSNNNELTGYLYMDLLNREGKLKNIRCFCLQSCCLFPLSSGKHQIPIVSVVAPFNYTKNIVLLNYQEVISLFHEMGHVIHQIFGKTKFIIFSGTNVENDFVEAPAQLLDSLCWEKNILKKLSCHYLNKSKLPDILINKLIKLKNLDIGLHYKKHILISLFDQLVYTSDNFVKLCEKSIQNNHNDLIYLFSNMYKQLFKEMMASTSDHDKYKIFLNEATILPVEWLNSFKINDSTYYCNTWSRVLSSDIFKEKLKGKPIKKTIGDELRKYILNYGGSKDAYDMVYDYLKRKPQINGFLALHDLDSEVEYSFFLTSDKNSVKKTIKNKIEIEKLKYDFDENDSVQNKFSEINESSIDVDYFKNKRSNIQDFTDDF